MNSEERDLISRFVERVGGAQTAPGAQGGRLLCRRSIRKLIASLKKISRNILPPVTGLRSLLSCRKLHWLRRRTVFVSLSSNCSRRVHKPRSPSNPLQVAGSSGAFWRGRQAQQQPQQPANNYPQGWGPQAAQRPPQQGGYAPPPGAQPGMFPRSGSGFLGSALSTAAGVAGGMMAANALEGLFSGHHDAAGSAGSVGSGVGSDAVGNDVSSDPFGGAGTQAPGFSDSDFPQQDDSSFGGDDGGDFGGGGFDDF